MDISISPTDSCASAARITPRLLGGIIVANPPLPRRGPILIAGSYPLFSISGYKEVANMAVEAILDPLSAALSVPAVTASKDSLPGILPIHLSKASKLLAAMPELKINSPIKMNNGTGSILKFVTERKTLNIICSKPENPPQSKKTLTILTNKNAKPIGIPIVKRKKRETNMAKRIIHHSICLVPILGREYLFL